MTLMTFDLSAVTDTLLNLVWSNWPESTGPIWTEGGATLSDLAGPAFFLPTFTGLAPDAVRSQSGPLLSMYLYHVEPDNAREALFWRPEILATPSLDPTSKAGPTRFLPQALNLYYLLFAYSEASYIQEQEAMSVAVRVFHDHPILQAPTGAAVPWELTLTMEHRSYDELSRLWQATTAPLRMSVVYRAAVVFLDSAETMPKPAQEATSVSVISMPPPSSSVAVGQPVLFGTFSESSVTGPSGPVPTSQAPATVAPGQSAWLVGSDLGVGGVSDTVYLLPPGGGAEADVTEWAVRGNSSPPSLDVDPSGTKLRLTLPSTGAPTPGDYQLRVGSGVLGSPAATRSRLVPISVVAEGPG
jgi:Pvc16 N-terminal domain